MGYTSLTNTSARQERERAIESIWWPHLSRDIKSLIKICSVCHRNRPNQLEQTLKPIALPDHPWSQLGIDLFEFKKKTYRVVVDYYSRGIEIEQLRESTSAEVISRMKALFTTFGISYVVISDNGSQYSSREFDDFAKDWGFSHHTSNPYKPQENGMAERTVKTAKELLKLEDPKVGLLNYRATPHSATCITPAEALMGRRIKTSISVLPRKLMPRTPDDSQIRLADQQAKATYKRYYDQRHGARNLLTLEAGEPVLIKRDKEKHWVNPGIVTSSSPDHRSYLVQSDGSSYRRNCTHLQEVSPGVNRESAVNTPPEPSTRCVLPEVSSSPHGPARVGPCAVFPPVPSIGSLKPPSTPVKITSSGRVVNQPIHYRDIL